MCVRTHKCARVRAHTHTHTHTHTHNTHTLIYTTHTQAEPLPFEALPGAESVIAAAFQHVAGSLAAAKLHSLLRAIAGTYYSGASPTNTANSPSKTQAQLQLPSESGPAHPSATAAAAVTDGRVAGNLDSEVQACAAAPAAVEGSGVVGMDDGAVEHGPKGVLSVVLDPITDKNARKV